MKVSKYSFELAIIAGVLGLPYGKFYRWYKHFLSDFKDENQQKKLHEHDLLEVSSKTGKEVSIAVPIFKSILASIWRLTKNRSIAAANRDIFYTVLSNGESGTPPAGKWR